VLQGGILDRVGKSVIAVFLATVVVVAASDLLTPRSLADVMRGGDPRVRQRLFDLLQPVSLANCELARFGEANDGGYLMCGNLLSEIQAAYSYGISGYDKWGCDTATAAGVRLHQYDCFDTRQPACGSAETVFHAECVAGVTKAEDGRPFDTIENHLQRNGDGGKRVAMKIDVEGAEWESLLEAPDAVLESIDQLAIEFHFVHEERFVQTVDRLKRFFHVAHLHFNNVSCLGGIEPFPTWAYEALLVSKRIGKVDVEHRVTLPHPLDSLNNPRLPDCTAATPRP
jgi:hypothetical protein